MDLLRRNVVGMVGAVLLVAFLGVIAFDAASKGYQQGDSRNLVRGTRVAYDCISRGELVACEAPEDDLGPFDRLYVGVGPYPLLQYVPAAVLSTLSDDDERVIRWVARLNWIAYVLLLSLLVVAAGALGSRVWVWLLPLVALVAPLPFYTTTGLGELLGALAVLGAIMACLHRRAWLALPLVALACVARETMAPFVLILGMLAARGPRDGVFPPRRMMLAIGAGTVVGLALVAAFNVFRYGGPRNMAYLDPLWRTDEPLRQLNAFAAQWVSPFGGLVWFWLPAVALTITVAVIGLRRLIRSPSDAASWLPPLLAVTVLVLTVAGLAVWWSPFGWRTWGPRLVIPVVPATLVVMVKTGGWELNTLVEGLLRDRRGALAIMVVAVVFAWPQVSSPWTWPRGIEVLDDSCPGPWIDEDAHHDCMLEATWRFRPNALWAASGGTGVSLVLARLLASSAIVLLIVQARSKALRRDERGMDPIPGHELQGPAGHEDDRTIVDLTSAPISRR